MSLTYSAKLLLTQGLPHQQWVFVRLTEHQAVEGVLIRAQGVDGGTAVVDNAIQQAEFGGGTTHLAHADVDADFRKAALPSAVTQSGLQLLSTGLSVTKQRHREKERDEYAKLSCEYIQKGEKTSYDFSSS